ncbi:flagellar biosynthetic protein FliO [Planococcus lenghuensis]|uniref:Flagellar protein n=1 Tax=Planococcus lenghuensis TaxID=2213202 RepID=A0A1Q2L2K9_9BACL|nr:flagellar biosynthetic protein FliO [Planococcus lenghuensis]AQQ54122.1 hypothetical protein B0X71_14095 [Planococcus lenghuensis]
MRYLLKPAAASLLCMLLISVAIILSPAAASAAPSVSDALENGTIDDEAIEETETTGENDTSLISVIVKLVFYTALIVVLIYALIKFLALRQQKLQPNQAVQLMGGTPLGNNKSLQLVKVGGQVYLIGVGDEVTLIKEFSDAAEIGAIEKSLETPSSFSLKSALTFGKPASDGETPKWSQGFESLFKQSLDRQRESREQLTSELHQAEEEREERSS